MPAFTPHLNLELPGGGSLGIGGDDETADVDDLNQNFQKIDTWADATDEKLDEFEGQAFYVGTDAERIALVPPKLRDGIRFQTTDTHIEWDRYNNKWRKRSGSIVIPSAPWQTISGGNAGRTASITIPYQIDASESVLIAQSTGGSGFTNASMNGLDRNATNTVVTVRLTQLMSAVQQSFTINWQIISIG